MKVTLVNESGGSLSYDKTPHGDTESVRTRLEDKAKIVGEELFLGRNEITVIDSEVNVHTFDGAYDFDMVAEKGNFITLTCHGFSN
jgi:hypothetical protein